MSANRFLLASAAGSTGSDTRNYAVYDSTDLYLRYGTIDVKTGNATEDGFFDISSSISSITVYTQSCIRHNGYIGLQSRRGFFVFRESDGAEVGRQQTGTNTLGNTAVSMCIVNDFIVGIEATGSTSFRVWKFDTTTETFTSVYSGSTTSSTALPVFGVSYFNTDTFALCYINGSNYDKIDLFNINTNARTNFYTGSVAFNSTYQHSVVIAPLNDTEYVTGTKQGNALYRLQSFDYATNTAQNNADIALYIGTSSKVGLTLKFEQGDNTDYLAFGLSRFDYNNYAFSLLQRNADATKLRAYEGTINSTTAAQAPRHTYGNNAYLFDNIFVATDGKIFDLATLEYLGVLQGTYVHSIFIS